MDRETKDSAELFDPTVRTTVDEVLGSIEEPGRLVEVTDQGETTYVLDRPLILIGKDPASDIVVEGRMVGDYHAEITYESGRYTIRHLDGRRKLTVGGKAVRESALTDCDEVGLADRTFVFRETPVIQQKNE
ncbi:MAG: FHA domain-containing protein [Candidatus Latescibacterota bacterium]|jgi:pSer/pThr/pTyr-binding forkhead associated (FHA) protein